MKSLSELENMSLDDLRQESNINKAKLAMTRENREQHQRLYEKSVELVFILESVERDINLRADSLCLKIKRQQVS